MSVGDRIFKSWSQQSHGQPTRDLHPNEIEVLRQAVQFIHKRSVAKEDVLFGFVLGFTVTCTLWIFGFLFRHFAG